MDPPDHLLSGRSPFGRRTGGRFAIFARLGIGVGLLVGLALVVEVGTDTISWSRDFLIGIAGASACIFVAQLVGARRWQIILGRDAPSWRKLVRFYLGSAFFSLFLPTTAGGDAYRATALGIHLGSIGRGVISTVVDRGFGLIALGLWFLVGILLAGTVGVSLYGVLDLEVRWVLLSSLAVGGALVVALILFGGHSTIRRFRASTSEAMTFVHRNLSRPSILASVFLLSVIVQGFYILAWKALAAGSEVELSLAFLLLAVPVVTLITMLPISISGLGVREGAWILVAYGLGASAAEIVVFSLSYFVAFAIVGLCGGIVLLGTDKVPLRANLSPPK
jgi:glycosyltransferase 2 family protein